MEWKPLFVRIGDALRDESRKFAAASQIKAFDQAEAKKGKKRKKKTPARHTIEVRILPKRRRKRRKGAAQRAGGRVSSGANRVSNRAAAKSPAVQKTLASGGMLGLLRGSGADARRPGAGGDGRPVAERAQARRDARSTIDRLRAGGAPGRAPSQRQGQSMRPPAVGSRPDDPARPDPRKRRPEAVERQPVEGADRDSDRSGDRLRQPAMDARVDERMEAAAMYRANKAYEDARWSKGDWAVMWEDRYGIDHERRFHDPIEAYEFCHADDGLPRNIREDPQLRFCVQIKFRDDMGYIDPWGDEALTKLSHRQGDFQRDEQREASLAGRLGAGGGRGRAGGFAQIFAGFRGGDG